MYIEHHQLFLLVFLVNRFDNHNEEVDLFFVLYLLLLAHQFEVLTNNHKMNHRFHKRWANNNRYKKLNMNRTFSWFESLSQLTTICVLISINCENIIRTIVKNNIL